MKVALAMTGGILIADRFDFSLQLSSILFGSLILISIIVFVLQRKSASAGQFLPFFLLCTIVALGSWKLTLDTVSVTKQPLLTYAGAGDELPLIGDVRDLPQKKPKTFQLVMGVHEVLSGKRAQATEGDILLYIPRDENSDSLVSSLRVGDRIAVHGDIEPLKAPRNPGDFDFRRYLLLNEISATMYLKSSADLAVVVSHLGGWSLRTGIARIRSSMASTIDETIGGVEGSFLKGILLGDRSDIPTEVKTSFINAGVVHVLAVSGLHVGMVALIFISVFSFLRVKKPLTTPLTIVCLLFYMLLTGSAPSVVRATVMAIVILLANVFQRKTDVFNSLAFGAIVIFFVDAKHLFNPGFQLSFAAVASILYFYPKIVTLSVHFPESLRASKLMDFLWKLFSVSFAAQVGTIPFTVVYFGKVSVVSFAANLFVIPAVGVGLALGFALSLFNVFWGWLAGIYGAAEQFLLEIVLKVVDFSGGLSFAYITIPSFSLLAFLVFYASAAFLLNLREKELRKRLMFALLILGNFAILPTLFDEGPNLRVTVIDVGQGDATLVQFPSGRTLLVDGGPKTFTYDAGEKIVVPFLKRTVSKLDVLIVTHPHSDHLGGVESILRSIPVGKVIDAGHRAESAIYRGYLQALKELSIPHESIRAGSLVGLAEEARIFVLHPTRSFVQTDSLHFSQDFNNGSVVLKVLYGKVKVLLTGDAEEPSEEQMLLLYDGFLESDLIKVGHHGSKTSSEERFVGSVRPQYAAISVGALNKFGHPSMDVVARYQTRGTVVGRTDEKGALMFETDGEIVSQVQWR